MVVHISINVLSTDSLYPEPHGCSVSYYLAVEGAKLGLNSAISPYRGLNVA